MRRLTPLLTTLLVAVSVPRQAAAQTPPSPTPVAGESASEAFPASPPVDDPQLAPPPPPPRLVRSWDEALALVRAQSPDYHSTYDGVLRAEAQARVALAALLPSATAQGTFAHQLITQNIAVFATQYPEQDAWGVTGNATWSPFDVRAYHTLGTAKLNVGASRADLSEKRRVIAESVVSTMLATLAAERVAELNRVGLRAALERLAMAQAKTRFGGGTELDIDRVGQDVAAARALIIAGDEALRQARESLGLALGSRVAIGAPGSLDLDRFEATVASTCRINPDLERRADVQAALRRVELAKRTVDDVWLQFLPTLILGSAVSWTSEPVYGPPTTWALEGALNVPIWDGGARYGYLRDARAAADQAEQALATTRLNEIVAVERASRAVGVAKASRDVAQQQRDLARRVDVRTRQGYLRGVGTSLDLVVSAQALRQAEINVALLQFQTAEARVLAVLANADCLF